MFIIQTQKDSKKLNFCIIKAYTKLLNLRKYEYIITNYIIFLR